MKTGLSIVKMTILYLVAIIAANLLVARFGPWIASVNALVFIPFNLTSKDSLQRRWGFGWKMIALILAGSVLSVLFSLSAWRIALASFAAFLLAGIGDALVFERLKRRGWLWQVNGSNVAGAILDSALFLILAFGWPPAWGALCLQILAKIFGGALWSVVLRPKYTFEELPMSRRDSEWIEFRNWLFSEILKRF